MKSNDLHDNIRSVLTELDGHRITIDQAHEKLNKIYGQGFREILIEKLPRLFKEGQ